MPQDDGESPKVLEKAPSGLRPGEADGDGFSCPECNGSLRFASTNNFTGYDTYRCDKCRFICEFSYLTLARMSERSLTKAEWEVMAEQEKQIMEVEKRKKMEAAQRQRIRTTTLTSSNGTKQDAIGSWKGNPALRVEYDGRIFSRKSRKDRVLETYKGLPDIRTVYHREDTLESLGKRLKLW